MQGDGHARTCGEGGFTGRDGALRRNQPHQLLAPGLAASRTERKSMSAAQAPGPHRLLRAAGAEHLGFSPPPPAQGPLTTKNSNKTRPPPQPEDWSAPRGHFRRSPQKLRLFQRLLLSWVCDKGHALLRGKGPGKRVLQAVV